MHSIDKNSRCLIQGKEPEIKRNESITVAKELFFILGYTILPYKIYE
jgi:hypothetical protein